MNSIIMTFSPKAACLPACLLACLTAKIHGFGRSVYDIDDENTWIVSRRKWMCWRILYQPTGSDQLAAECECFDSEFQSIRAYAIILKMMICICVAANVWTCVVVKTHVWIWIDVRRVPQWRAVLCCAVSCVCVCVFYAQRRQAISGNGCSLDYRSFLFCAFSSFSQFSYRHRRRLAHTQKYACMHRVLHWIISIGGNVRAATMAVTTTSTTEAAAASTSSTYKTIKSQFSRPSTWYTPFTAITRTLHVRRNTYTPSHHRTIAPSHRHRRNTWTFGWAQLSLFNAQSSMFRSVVPSTAEKKILNHLYLSVDDKQRHRIHSLTHLLTAECAEVCRPAAKIKLNFFWRTSRQKIFLFFFCFCFCLCVCVRVGKVLSSPWRYWARYTLYTLWTECTAFRWLQASHNAFQMPHRTAFDSKIDDESNIKIANRHVKKRRILSSAKVCVRAKWDACQNRKYDYQMYFSMRCNVCDVRCVMYEMWNVLGPVRMSLYSATQIQRRRVRLLCMYQLNAKAMMAVRRQE